MLAQLALTPAASIARAYLIGIPVGQARLVLLDVLSRVLPMLSSTRARSLWRTLLLLWLLLAELTELTKVAVRVEVRVIVRLMARLPAPIRSRSTSVLPLLLLLAKLGLGLEARRLGLLPPGRLRLLVLRPGSASCPTWEGRAPEEGRLLLRRVLRLGLVRVVACLLLGQVAPGLLLLLRLLMLILVSGQGWVARDVGEARGRVLHRERGRLAERVVLMAHPIQLSDFQCGTECDCVELDRYRAAAAASR